MHHYLLQITGALESQLNQSGYYLIFSDSERFATQDEIAQAQALLDQESAQAAQDEIDIAGVKNYPKLIALKNMTPDEIQTWVNNNINTFADAKDALKTLAIAVGFLARRL